jgi:ABC-type antimicrobial peptide transport system permease subunit
VSLEVSPRTVALELLAAGITGLVAGLYPARNATRVEIVTALRSE